jgi:hypothetical protein
MNLSPLRSSPHQTPIQNQRQGVTFGDPAELETLYKYVSERGVTPEHLSEVKQAFNLLQKNHPELPARLNMNEPFRLPANLTVGLNLAWDKDPDGRIRKLTDAANILSPEDYGFLHGHMFTKDQPANLAIMAFFPYDQPKKVIEILNLFNIILDKFMGGIQTKP